MAVGETIKAQVRADYKTGDFSISKLASKYSLSRTTIQRAIEGVKKGAITGTVEADLDAENRKAILTELERHGINDQRIALELAQLLEDKNPSIKIQVIRELNRLKANYTEDKTFNLAMFTATNLHLPDNKRDNL